MSDAMEAVDRVARANLGFVHLTPSTPVDPILRAVEHTA